MNLFQMYCVSIAVVLRQYTLIALKDYTKMGHRNHGTKVTDEQLADLLSSRSNTDEVPILQRKAEDRIRRELRDVALKGCAREITDFAKCAQGRVLSVVWACRSLNRNVDKCMKQFANDEALQDVLRRRFVRF